MTVETVARDDDPRLAPYRDLPAHDGGRRDGLFVAETREVVRQLVVGARFRIRSVLLTESALGALADCLAARPEVPVYLAPRAVLQAVVGFDFHRGCLALGERGAEPGLDDLLRPAPRRLVLLEDVSNPDNVGGVLRAAWALGADAVVLSPGCCDPLYRKAVRVSVGAALALPWARVADWPGALGAVRAAGYALIALTPRGRLDVVELEAFAARRTALLLGTEGAGLCTSTLAAADVTARIPIVAGVDSLNVTTACAVALDRLGGARRSGA